MTELLTPTQKKVLIASSSLDIATWLPVAKELDWRGYDVTSYEADKVADSRIPLLMRVDRYSGLNIYYDGQLLKMAGIAAAWYRRPDLFAEEQADKAKQLSLDEERRAIQYSLWDSVPKRAWLNQPQRAAYAEHKVTQLIMAAEVGFDIPYTVISNTWKPIVETLPENVIVKPSDPFSYRENELRALFTTPLNNPSELPADANPFPGFWQPNIPKAREWRITVVGDRTFDTAIYTADDAKDDWRKHQADESKVSYKIVPFPEEQKEKCVRYLTKMGLGFGIFDFIEDPDGKISFLECNPNGQYGWLEKKLGFNISDAIADELASIADAQAV